MIKEVATVAVYVESQQDSLRFWTERAGFELRHSQPMGPKADWLEVGPPGSESCLVIYPKSMMKDWAERRPSIVFECADIPETYRTMHSREVEFVQEPKPMAWGPFAIFRDLDGNQLGLRER
jgi:catechol 2,3-dioxygenase-like lactoylglutathione lyase family enzyme